MAKHTRPQDRRTVRRILFNGHEYLRVVWADGMVVTWTIQDNYRPGVRRAMLISSRKT